MRVMITGGFGCIGSWVVKLLTDHGHFACLFDARHDTRRIGLLMDPATIARLPIVLGDVSDTGSLVRALTEHRIDHVLHLAGLQVPGCRADPIRGALVNVVGTLAVFEAVKQLRSQIRSLVYASSAAVYGPSSFYANCPQPLASTERLSPTTLYGAFKVANESNAQVYWSENQLGSIGLRPGTVYGVGRDFGMTSEPTKAIKAVVLGRSWTISYQGPQDFQFAEDVAATMIRCLERPSAGAMVYNVRGQVSTVQQFVDDLATVAPRAKELIRVGTATLSLHHDLSDADLQNDFGPLPKTSLAEGVRRTWEQFTRLHADGRLDDYDLTPPTPVATTDV